jgi:lipopolysaccharide transport protein LptA
VRFVPASVAVVFCGMTSVLLFAQQPATKVASKTSASPSPEKTKTSASPEKFDFSHPTEPITTEIYADDAFFDSAKNVGKFTGNVKVNDPRFAMQSEKLTAYIAKEDKGLEKAVADGHVAVVRNRPDPKGGPPLQSIGLSDNAIYTTSDGIIQLRGNPRVQQGINMHIATSPDTVMMLNQDGQLTTHGPSRTEIRQQPSPSPSPGASTSASPTETPKK